MGSQVSDITLPSDGEDTIASLSWSPVRDHLAAASWDGKVRIYDVSSTGHAQRVSTLLAEQPALSCDWAKVSHHRESFRFPQLPSARMRLRQVEHEPVSPARSIDGMSVDRASRTR